METGLEKAKGLFVVFLSAMQATRHTINYARPSCLHCCTSETLTVLSPRVTFSCAGQRVFTLHSSLWRVVVSHLNVKMIFVLIVMLLRDGKNIDAHKYHFSCEPVLVKSRPEQDTQLLTGT